MKLKHSLICFFVFCCTLFAKAQTFTMVDIWPGEGNSIPADFTALNGKLYFSARDSIHGRELWVTDGTPAGTHIVKDIMEGPADSSPSNFFALNNVIVFLAYTWECGIELWVTDGTFDGTHVLLDILPGYTSSEPLQMRVRDSVLAFAAKDAFTYHEWETNGTTAGTIQYASYIVPFGYAFYKGRVYFYAWPGGANGLWATDGTWAGTVEVKSFFQIGTWSHEPWEAVVFKDLLFFIAQASGYGMELWASDGSEPGTKMVADINAGQEHAHPEHLTVCGKNLFFAAIDTAYGNEL